MSLFHDSALVGASGQAGGAGYSISRSIRLNSADSAYLSRTPASAGNRKTWTWAGWVKKAKLGNPTYQATLSAGTSNTDINYIFVGGYGLDDAFGLIHYNGSFVCNIETTNVFRDVSAWYHLLVAVDTTQATASNRVKIYVNGSQVTSFSSSIYPSQDHQFNINNTSIHHIGSIYGTRFLDAYLADIHFIDGQALDPTSFGEFSATTGVWVPKAYTGTYGTNGFRLDFADNSAATATTLGKDAAGSNNWTPNNLSVTAGAGNDSLVDVPTNGSEVDTGLGGQVRGNYCTLNPLASNVTLSDGNLKAVTASNAGVAYGTIYVSSGKYYAEVTLGDGGALLGVMKKGATVGDYIGMSADAYAYYGNGQKLNNNVFTNYGTAISTGDVVGIALNMDAGSVTFYLNGTSQGTAFTGLSGEFTFVTRGKGSGDVTNFGQRPFAYPVSGFKALCTANLPAPLVTKPSDVMDVKLITANNSTQAVTGLGFSPDLVWTKSRSNAFSHYLYDTVRGASKFLISNATNAEATIADSLISFDSSGFTLGANDGANYTSGASVAWCWDAGTTTVTNTQGSISSQVRANPSAGFSVISYTGNGSSGATIAHGLGAAPEFFIVKCRNTAGTGWLVYAKPLGATSFLQLESTAAVASNATAWNNTAPSSTLITLGNSAFSNGNAQTYVCYSFAPVVGYSSFGSYTGNGSADGPFVFCGFRPRWLLFKNTNVAGQYWDIYDTARDTYNASGLRLFPNASDAENDARPEYDILSNGFKVRDSSTSANGNGNTIIYAAFAESPFGANNRAR